MSRIFINYRRESAAGYAGRLYDRLVTRFGRDSVYMDVDMMIPLGRDFVDYIREAVQHCEVMLVLIDRRWLMASDEVGQRRLDNPTDYVRLEIESALRRRIPVIPIFIQSARMPRIDELPSNLESLAYRQGLELRDERFNSDVGRLIKSLEMILINENTERFPPKPIQSSNLTLLDVELVNIRCFRNFYLDFSEGSDTIRWTIILGDNAAGKTTLLRSIALSLCRENEAATLMQEIPGGFIRQGQTEGRITIRLQDDYTRDQIYTITTFIRKTPDAVSEIVRQETDPPNNFPWSNIFVCGYGTHRTTQADASYEDYHVLPAVRSLFDNQTALQNPELILLRQAPQVRTQMERKLLQLLMLEAPADGFHFPQGNLELQGPWGRLPLEALSDGYRSTAQWVLDFIGWSIYAHRFLSNPDIGGILLIDELEQHLHPRWQRFIVQRLRQQFPSTQIIATTHTPLTTSGIVDVAPSLLLKLEQDDEGAITKRIIDTATLAGKRADQILASEAFGLVTTRNPGSEDDFDRYAALLGKPHRTKDEENEVQDLGARLKQTLQRGENEVTRTVEQAVDNALSNVLHNLSPDQLDLETKRQLREIFRSETPE